MSAQQPNIYQLKVTLRHSEPAIWRRILVYGDISFYDLHDILQVVMGWEDEHSFQFILDEITLAPEDVAREFGYRDADEVLLDELLTDEPMRFIYEYDFEDAWEHTVMLEKRVPFQEDQVYPICVEGARACPPEGVGGIWGYKDLLDALADPTHELHDEMVDWVDEDFDPEAFSAEEVNAILAEEWHDNSVV